MSHCLSVIDDGGFVLLSRAYGAALPPPFATVALLGAISRFSENAGLTLDGLGTKDVRVAYRKFHGGFLFVLVTNNLVLTKEALRNVLQYLYNAFVVVLGHAALGIASTPLVSQAPGTPYRPERLKRQIRGSLLPLIDQVLKDIPCSLSTSFDAPRVRHTSASSVKDMAAALASLAREADTPYAALVTPHGYVAGTQRWWELQSAELLTVQELVQTKPSHSCPCEEMVYLSCQDGSTPLRLIMHDVVEATAGDCEYALRLVLVCGKEPSMATVASLARVHLDRLNGELRIACNAPDTGDGDIKGVILYERNHCASAPQACVGYFCKMHAENPLMWGQPLKSADMETVNDMISTRSITAGHFTETGLAANDRVITQEHRQLLSMLDAAVSSRQTTDSLDDRSIDHPTLCTDAPLSKLSSFAQWARPLIGVDERMSVDTAHKSTAQRFRDTLKLTRRSRKPQKESTVNEVQLKLEGVRMAASRSVCGTHYREIFVAMDEQLTREETSGKLTSLFETFGGGGVHSNDQSHV